MRKSFASVLFLLFCFWAKAQQNPQTVDMADTFRSSGKIYVVVAVILVIFAGIIIYLVRLDRKITKLENNHELLK